MKAAIIIAILIVSMSFEFAQAQSRFSGFDRGQQGIGLLLGAPTGARYVYWTNWRRAIFADLLYDWDGIALTQASYAFYFFDTKDRWRKKGGFNSFLFYLAPGVLTGFRVKGSDSASKFILGARGAGGAEYLFGSGRIGIRAELGAGLLAIGRTFATLQAFAGVTYYFSD